MKRSNKKNKKLVFSLTRNYVVFLLIMATIFISAYLVSGILVEKFVNKTENGNVVSYILDKSGSIDEPDFKFITDINGFVQVLDSERVVVKQFGNPLGKVKQKYTEDELLSMIAVNNEATYTVIVSTLSHSQYGKVTVLYMLPKDKIDYQVNIFNIPYSVGKDYINLYIKVLVITILLFIIIIILYSILTTRNIKIPLKKIDEALGDIVEGNYSTKIDLQGANEFIVIGQTINYLTYKLERSVEENKKLEESKNKMILDLSHDIKTPITTIKAFSSALYEGMITDEEKKMRYYNTIAKKSEMVEELVNELFDYAKLDNGVNIKKEKVNLCEFMREIILKYIDEFEEREFELNIEIQEETIIFEMDTRLFKRAIANIFQNALKYNPNGTKLRVTVLDNNSEILIEIADNGIGIPEKVKPFIFDTFVRGDESRKSDGGTGVGLSISKKVIELHNGTIVLRSSSQEITIFTIQLHI